MKGSTMDKKMVEVLIEWPGERPRIVRMTKAQSEDTVRVVRAGHGHVSVRPATK